MFSQRHRLCYGCLWSRHSSRDCRKKKVCGKDGCLLKHHPLLHEPKRVTSMATSNSARSESPRVALGTHQIFIEDSQGRLIRANLVSDEGSDTTLVREALVQTLGIRGRPKELNVQGVGGILTRYSSEEVYLKIHALSGDRFYIKASTMPVVASPVPVINWEKLRSRWSHLEDLDISSSGGDVDILLGLDYANLTALKN